jgi:hypothetical protein
MKGSAAEYRERLGTSFSDGWTRFWFAPGSAWTLGVVRTTTAVAVALALAAYWPDVERWFAPQGMIPRDFIRDLYPSQWSPLDRLSPGAVRVVLVIAVAASALWALGLGGRGMAVATWIFAASFFHRTPLTNGPFEAVALPLLAYLCIGRAAEGWAPASRLFGGGGGGAPPLAASNTIAVRLIQIHVALIHAMMAVAQLSAEGNVWLSGEGMWLAASQAEIAWLDFSWLASRPRLAAAWSHAITLYLIALPLFAWRRLLAPVMVAAAAVAWLSIAAATGQGLFALATWGATWAFLGPAEQRVGAAAGGP